ncbi:uncharacterized protein BDR25DRAFT_359180, partial [Lindgomyces ingoldianus]
MCEKKESVYHKDVSPTEIVEISVCIDKTNDAELSRAINSMFRWYRNAARCYVYLSDPWELEFQRSRWFTRGWTLQELLAPSSVEFFSQEGKRLDNEYSGFSAPRGPFILVQRQQLNEDKAYSLLGIFRVYVLPIYGEGTAMAFKRLMDEISKLEKCKRIKDTKGGLLKDSYRWILKNSNFQQWRDDQQSRLLWIKGDPGKGKTMLLCGIVNKLKKSIATTDLLSYFFCQAADSRINNATSVLQGLLYLLVNQQPSLANRSLRMRMPSTLSGLPKLLDFIARMSSVCPRIKWMVSSRNWPSIKKDLKIVMQNMRLCLKLNKKSISTAVATYIRYKVDQLAERNGYSNNTQDAVQSYLLLNANDTFLWVALVCQELVYISQWDARQKLTTFPPGLNGLYGRMIDQMKNSEVADLCKRILAILSVMYRPLTLDELTSFIDMPDGVAGDYEALSEIIGLCGSFLTLRERTILFVHQSAKDFLLKKASNEIFPSGKGETHHEIFLRSLKVMSRTLRRDIYSLGALGYPIERVKQPDPDPLAASRYSCIYWVDHLCDWNSNSCAKHGVDLQDSSAIKEFVRKNYLYWLEALSLCRSMSNSVVSMGKLKALLQGTADVSALLQLVRDARRFVMYHKQAIEDSPLQAYTSGLVFTPICSLIRDHFKEEEPKGITIRPDMEDKWSACLQTLEGHSDSISSLASGSDDNTVKIWDASSG